MNLRSLIEGYANELGWLARYIDHGRGGFKQGDGSIADNLPYDLWWELCQNLGEKYSTPSDVFKGAKEKDWEEFQQENDPSIWFEKNKLPKADQEEILSDLWQSHRRDADSPTYFSLEKLKYLPSHTWLIRFSAHSDNEWYHGFTVGHEDFQRLGLTTWMEKPKGAGYNFAMVAGDRDSYRGQKYGLGAVMFQSAGVLAHHEGDQEEQVIFWGPSVRPENLARLYKDPDTFGDFWYVDAHNDKSYVFQGSLDACQKWVMANFQQYRRLCGGGRA